MSKEVIVYGYNSVETSVLKNPENIIELYIDESSSNKRIEKLLSGMLSCHKTHSLFIRTKTRFLIYLEYFFAVQFHKIHDSVMILDLV